MGTVSIRMSEEAFAAAIEAGRIGPEFAQAKEQAAKAIARRRESALGPFMSAVEGALEKVTSGYRRLGNGLVEGNPGTVVVLRRD